VWLHSINRLCVLVYWTVHVNSRRQGETWKGNKITTTRTRTAAAHPPGAAHTSCIYWPHVVRALRQISCRQYEWTVCDKTEQMSPVRGEYTQIHVVSAYTLKYGTRGALYRDGRRLLYSATVREKKIKKNTKKYATLIHRWKRVMHISNLHKRPIEIKIVKKKSESGPSE